MILTGLAERWGVLDTRKNPDLNDIASSYAAGCFLVAWQGTEIVGSGAFLPRARDTVEIVRMSVRKEKRRQGIGSALLKALCWQAYRRGYRRAILETTATWEDAIAFYRHFGFRATHQKDGDLYFALALRAFAQQKPPGCIHTL